MAKTGLKRIAFTEAELKLMESAVLNGQSLADIGKAFGTTEKTMLLNFRYSGNAKKVYERAIETIQREGTTSLRKLAEGFTVIECERGEEVKEAEKLKELFYSMLEVIPIWSETRKRGVEEQFLKLLAEGTILKSKERYFPPDRLSAIKLLEVSNEEVWDLESKRKKIPDVKIVVSVDGETNKKKAIKADFEIIPEKTGAAIDIQRKNK